MGAKRQQILITVDSTPNSDEPLTLALVFDSAPKRGQPIHGRFVAAGGTGGYVITLKDHTSLPDGVTFNSLTGELSGTPTAMGRTAFIAGVQDSSASESDPTRFSIDVLSGLKFGRHLSKYIGQVNVPLNAVLPGVLGATGSITWTLDSGSFHSGLSLVGAAVTGTPLAPGGITYASLLVTDAGSGDTLPLRFVTDIREGMVDIAPDVPVEVLGGIPTTINLMEYFTGGVGPFRMEVIADSFPPGLELVRTPGNDWFMTGVPEMDAYEGDDLWSPVGVDVFDALGAQLSMAWSVLIRNPINSIGTMRGGVPSSDRTAAVLDFIGSAVKSVDVEPDFSKTTIEIEPQANAFSVLGRSGAAGGDAQNITASANDRVMARVAGALIFTQVTAAMMATSAAVLSISGATGALTFSGAAPINVGLVGSTFTFSHANSGVSAGTYTNCTVTVDVRGHITSISSGTAPVTSVGASAPLASSGGATPTISHNNSGVAAGAYGKAIFNASGHATAGVQDYTTIVSVAALASVNYTHFDFATMTDATDVVRFTGSAGGTSGILGFRSAPYAGQTVMLINASTTTLTLTNQSGSEGTAAARFAIGANFSLLPDHACLLWHDGTTARWRIIGSY